MEIDETNRAVLARFDVATPDLEYRLSRLRGDVQALDLIAEGMRGDGAYALASIAATMGEHLAAISAAVYATGISITRMPCPMHYRIEQTKVAND